MSHGLVTPGATVGERAAAAIADPGLQRALRNLDTRRYTARAVAEGMPERKDRAAAIRRETLADLEGWVQRASGALTREGAHVHRAATPADVNRIVIDIAHAAGLTRVIKSKSMATEEVDLVDALEAVGIAAVETDLGEYIVQVADERPSHMITPAIHKTVDQIAELLGRVAGETLPADHEAITEWARTRLREEFLRGDLGITGANFVTADTGTIVIVTNEGNADLCTLIPRVHIAVVPVEKVIPRLSDLADLLPVLTRSATGQDISNYLTMVTGPRREGELDGPEELHVVFLDHGRLALVGTEYEDMLACIRCGACLNVCPVFRRISGHAYAAVYTGPMGKILTPLLSATGEDGRELPGASTLCGACAEACPVEIPLVDLLVRLRADLRTPGPVSPRASAGGQVGTHPLGVTPAPAEARRPGEGMATAANATPLRLARHSSRPWSWWAAAWSFPRGYRVSARIVAGAASVIAPRRRSHARSDARSEARSEAGADVASAVRWSSRAWLGTRGWTASRDLPLPSARAFRDHWRDREAEGW